MKPKPTPEAARERGGAFLFLFALLVCLVVALGGAAVVRNHAVFDVDILEDSAAALSVDLPASSAPTDPPKSSSSDREETVYTALAVREKIELVIRSVVGPGVAGKESALTWVGKDEFLNQVQSEALVEFGVDFFERAPVTGLEESRGRLIFGFEYAGGAVEYKFDKNLVEALKRAAPEDAQAVRWYIRSHASPPGFVPYTHPLSPLATPVLAGKLVCKDGVSVGTTLITVRLEP